MRRIVAVILLLAPVSAWAQEEEEAAPLSTVSKEDRKAEKVVEVEHGFYIGIESGLSLLLAAPGGDYTATANAVSKEGLSTGQSVGVELGFEPIPMISIGLIAIGTNAGTSATYIGTQDPGLATATSPLVSGNMSMLTLGANGRFNLSLGEDGNGQRRTYLYLRVGAGYTLARPTPIVANELTVFGGPGIEYFTRLRHFSVGFEVLPSIGLTNKGFALIAQPVVRYSF